MSDPEKKELEAIQSQLVITAHSYRMADRFKVSQALSDAAVKVGKAIREMELSKQAACFTSNVADGK